MTIQTEILISNMLLSLNMGVSEAERSCPQKVRLSGEIRLHPGKTSGFATDRIEDTLDYAQVADTLKKASRTIKPHLLEKLGYHLGETLLQQFPAIVSVSLTLTKDPSPLAAHPETNVSVKITLTKEGNI